MSRLKSSRVIFFSFSRLIELFLRIRRLDFVELAVDFLFGGQQAEFFGAVHHHFVVDHLAQNVQAENRGLLADGGLLGAGHRIVVVLVDVGAEDLAAIHRGHHVAANLGFATQQRRQQNGGRQRCREPGKVCISFQRGFSPALTASGAL